MQTSKSRTPGGYRANCKTNANSNSLTARAKYHKAHRRQILKGRIVAWAIDGKISPDAARKALEFMKLVQA